MKRKASLSCIKNGKCAIHKPKKPTSYYNQGVPIYIICDGKEYNIIFNRGEKLNNFKQVPEEGTAIIDGDEYDIILFRYNKDDIICLIKGNGNYKLKDKEGTWCYNYDYIYIQYCNNIDHNVTPIYKNTKIFDTTNKNPYHINRYNDKGCPNGCINMIRSHISGNLGKMQPIITCRTPYNNKHIIEVYCTTKRKDYIKYIRRNTIKILCIKEFFRINNFPNEIFVKMIKDNGLIWKINKIDAVYSNV